MISKRTKGMSDNTRLAEEYLQASAEKAVQQTEPRPGFQEAALFRIEKRLDQTEKAGRREARHSLAYPGHLRKAVLVPVVALAVMVLFTTGAYAFSLDAAPDSSLYGTKLFFENTRTTLAGSDDAKADYEIRLIEKRLNEIQSLVEKGATRGGAHWEAAYRNNVDRLYEQILSLPEERQAEMLQYVASLLEEQAEMMSTLDSQAPQDLALT